MRVVEHALLTADREKIRIPVKILLSSLSISQNGSLFHLKMFLPMVSRGWVKKTVFTSKS